MGLTTTAESVLARAIEQPNGCRFFPVTNSHGYGMAWLNGKTRAVHKIAWEHRYGPVPAGKEIEISCCHRSCCNTDHMELVPAHRRRTPTRGLGTASAATGTVSTAEAATLLGISEKSVMRAIHQESLVAERLGRSWAVERTALVTYQRPKRGRPAGG